MINMQSKNQKRFIWNKGKNLTKRHKENISKSRKGAPTWNKGKKWSDKIKKKISNSKKGQDPWNKGKKWSKKVKKKIQKTKLSTELKFIELYNIFENNLGNTLKIDQWLQSRDPAEIPIINCNRRNETLPTHVRNCIYHNKHGKLRRIELIKALSILTKLKSQVQKNESPRI